MKPEPAAPESNFLRYTRRVLYISVLAIPTFIALAALFSELRIWWLMMWMSVMISLSALVCLVAACVRLGHALWVNSQYAMSELLITFFAAGLTSMGLLEWAKVQSRSTSQETGAVVSIVLCTFVLFLGGSAWGWGVFRRAEGIGYHRIGVLVCGWISALGLVSFALFLLLSLLLVMIGQLPMSDSNYYGYFLLGSALTIPGIFIELAVRKYCAELHAKQVTPSPLPPVESAPSGEGPKP
jgi:hypothetical protein